MPKIIESIEKVINQLDTPPHMEKMVMNGLKKN